MAANEVLKGVDAYIVTHVHPDHIDMGPRRNLRRTTLP